MQITTFGMNLTSSRSGKIYYYIGVWERKKIEISRGIVIVHHMGDTIVGIEPFPKSCRADSSGQPCLETTGVCS